MQISHAENHGISVFAGQGDLVQLQNAVQRLADREQTTPDEILIACKDDYHQTAAHIAAKAGQTREHIHASASEATRPQLTRFHYQAL